MNFGKVLTAECINTPSPPDNRCEDPAFRIANPNLCPTGPRLIIKPSAVLVCELGSVQLAAVVIRDGAELDVTDQSVFTSSNANVVVVGAASGNATGMADGEANITASFEDLTATAHITVLEPAASCCEEISTAFMVMVDQTKSMGQAFGGAYGTKLAYAKAAATRFISEINETKDLIGLMRFSDTNTILSVPVSDKAAVGALVAGISQTQQLTNYYTALSAAIVALNDVAVDQRVLLIITDGEDQDDSYLQDDNPIELLGAFKANGGLVISLGVRAHGAGYSLLSEFSTGGFFLNAWPATPSITSNAELALGYLSGLKGYICSGNCAPAGDVYAASGQLNYCGFANWHVADGHVDLVGNGFLDLLPGNNLYVDMAGSQATFKGKLVSKVAYPVVSGTGYRLSIDVAGNQRLDASPNSIEARVFSVNNDGLTTPATAPVSSISGSGSAFELSYEWAVSYLNDEGETPLSPISSASNNSFSTWSNHVTHVGEASATLARLWRREVGQAEWQLRAESVNVAAPVFDDPSTVGSPPDCTQPVTVNMTGTKNVRVSQTITVNDFQQPFQPYSLSFTAPLSENVYLSIQQISSPAGYDAIGLLVGCVVFETTGGTNLLDDTFENENLIYIPPACGTGITPIDVTVAPIDDPDGVVASQVDYPGHEIEFSEDFFYSISWVTAEGETALSVEDAFGVFAGTDRAVKLVLPPPPASVTSVRIWRNADFSLDRFLLATVTPGTSIYYDLESLDQFDARKDAAVIPPVTNTTGTSSAGTTTPAFETALVPEMTSNTTPSGVASASSVVTNGTGFHEAYHAFKGSSIGWEASADVPQWIAYQFPSPVAVNRYAFLPFATSTGCTWTFQGSQDGAAWDTLDTQTTEDSGDFWPAGVSIANTTEYLHYRLNFTAIGDTFFPNVTRFQVFHTTPEVIIPGYASYAYVTGYNCYGEGCLDEPPPEQQQDPNPLPDIESDTPPPPQTYTASRTVCKVCPTGFTNYAPQVSAVPLSSELPYNPFRKAFAWDLATPATPVQLLMISGNFIEPSTYVLYSSATSLIGVVPTTVVASGSIPAGFSASIPLVGLAAYAHFKLLVTSGSDPNVSLMMALPSLLFSATPQVCATEDGEGSTPEAAIQDATTNATAAALALLNCVPVFSRTVVATSYCPTNTFGGPFTASATATSQNSDAEALDAATTAAQAAADALRDASGCSGSNNTQMINILDGPTPPTKASPYPSVKHVTGVTGLITKVTCVVKKIDHGAPEDIRIMLRSPAGTCVELMSNAGGPNILTINASITFDDDAAGFVPTPIIEGTYKPTLLGAALQYPSPAPALPYGVALSDFVGENPNGSWACYLCDDTSLDFGHAVLGWDLTITSA